MLSKERLFALSKQLDIPESSIDESIYPILVALEKNQLATQQLLHRVENQVKPVSYPNLTPKAALMIRWGWGVWLTPLLLVSMVASYVVIQQNSELAKLRSVVEKDPKTGVYFVRVQNYQVVPGTKQKLGGIVLKIPK